MKFLAQRRKDSEDMASVLYFKEVVTYKFALVKPEAMGRKLYEGRFLCQCEEF